MKARDVRIYVPTERYLNFFSAISPRSINTPAAKMNAKRIIPSADGNGASDAGDTGQHTQHTAKTEAKRVNTGQSCGLLVGNDS